MKVRLVNPANNFAREIKIGWSWTLFFFAPMFGIPLFMRGLAGWGALFILAVLAQMTVPSIVPPFPRTTHDYAVMVTNFVFVGLIIFMAMKGNEITAKALFGQGWKFAEPDSPEAATAKKKWRLL